jgi:hypothetical protein
MSFVPRIPALMLLSLGLLACGTAASSAARVDSGVSGRVFVGPTCPVERPGQVCERAYRTTLAVYAGPSHRLVTRVRSDREGRFQARLVPGRYVLQGTNRGLPRWTPKTVTVRAHRFTQVTLVFDTGIR